MSGENIITIENITEPRSHTPSYAANMSKSDIWVRSYATSSLSYTEIKEEDHRIKENIRKVVEMLKKTRGVPSGFATQSVREDRDSR